MIVDIWSLAAISAILLVCGSWLVASGIKRSDAVLALFGILLGSGGVGGVLDMIHHWINQ